MEKGMTGGYSVTFVLGIREFVSGLPSVLVTMAGASAHVVRTHLEEYEMRT